VADRDGLKGDGRRSTEKFREMRASVRQAESLLDAFAPTFVEATADQLPCIGSAALAIGERHGFQIALDPDDLELSGYRDAYADAVDRLTGLEQPTFSVAKAEALLVSQAQLDINRPVGAFEAFGDDGPSVVRLSGQG
jgi:hypothetical protein